MVMPMFQLPRSVGTVNVSGHRSDDSSISVEDVAASGFMSYCLINESSVKVRSFAIGWLFNNPILSDSLNAL